MAESSTIYFPLRSNAASLITGRGVGDVRRRLMLASLLHDEVWIEAGLLSVMAGPDGSNAWHRRGIDPASVTWQSPRARNQGEGQEFGLAFGIEPEPGVWVEPTHAMPLGTSTISWEATFEPFRRELPREAAGWITYVDYIDPPAAKQIARRWSFTEFVEPDKWLTRRWPEQFIRDVFVKGTHLDIAAAETAGASLSIDRAHRPVVDALIRRNVAERLPRDHLLDLIVPVGTTWTDVVDLRSQDGALAQYRVAIREAANAVTAAAELGVDFEHALLEEWGRRIGEASTKGAPKWIRRGVVGLGFVAGIAVDAVTATTPLIGIAGAAAAELAGGTVQGALDRRAKPRWLAIDARLRRPRA